MRGYCRVPHSFFLDLPQKLTFSEYVCLGLIVSSTVGWQRDRAYLTLQQFTEVARVTPRAVQIALDRLRELDLVAWTIDLQSNQRAYSVAASFWPDGDAVSPKALAKCPSCRAVCDVELVPAGAAPIPQSYFRDLPKRAKHHEFVVVGMVLQASVRWDEEERGLTFSPARLTVEEIMAASGLEKRRVQGALRSAETKGWIERKERSGKRWEYTAKPENFVDGDARARRTVERPDPGEEAPKPVLVTRSSLQRLEHNTPAIEFTARAFGRCMQCREIHLVTLVGEPPRRLAASARPVRNESPPVKRDSGPPPRASREIQGLEDYLWRWSQVLGVPPSPEVVDEISAAMGEASLADFIDVCEKRRGYIERQGRGYKLFIPVASDVAKVAARWQEGRKRAATREARKEVSAAEKHAEWEQAEQRALDAAAAKSERDAAAAAAWAAFADEVAAMSDADEVRAALGQWWKPGQSDTREVRALRRRLRELE